MRAIFSSLDKRHAILFDRMMKSEQVAPSFTVSRFICLVIAVVVHLVTLSFALLTAYFMILAIIALVRGEWSAVFALSIVTVLSFGIIHTMRPRPGKYPEITLSRQKYPELYALVYMVANALHSRHIDKIAFSEAYNAGFRRVGLRQEWMLTLGIPLWAMLNAEERVALLGHEIAHGINGDYTRGFVIGSAFNALQYWHAYAYYLLAERSVAMLAGIVLIIVTGPPFWLLNTLMFYESQQAEYFADSLGASVSGTDATLSLLAKLQFSNQFRTFVSYANSSGASKTILERYKDLLETTIPDPTTMERVDAETNWRETRFYRTHPPLPYRKQFLAAHRVETAQITLLEQEARLLQNEFDPVAKRFSDMLMQRKARA